MDVKVEARENVWEMTRVPDGRATFSHGDPIRDSHHRSPNADSLRLTTALANRLSTRPSRTRRGEWTNRAPIALTGRRDRG